VPAVHTPAGPLKLPEEAFADMSAASPETTTLISGPADASGPAFASVRVNVAS